MIQFGKVRDAFVRNAFVRRAPHSCIAQPLEPRVLLASAELVTDINRTTVSSIPDDLTAAPGEVVYFDAVGNTGGRELWKSDGTAAGTVMVKDINPGPASSFPLFDYYHPLPGPEFTPVGDTNFFIADDGAHGRELWKTDGTEAGTLLVKDVRPGAEGSGIRQLEALGDVLLFAADDGSGAGTELWRSDGTEAGTRLVKDIDPRPGFGADPDDLTSSGGRVYFAATTENEGRELWSTDGTAAGTRLVADLSRGDPSNLFDAGGTLYFDTGGFEAVQPATLWKTTGTAASTTQVAPSVVADRTVPMARLGDTVFFASAYFSPAAQRDLYRTDGTPAGTTRILSPQGDTMPRNLTPMGSYLYFTAREYVGNELYRIDATAVAATLVKDINPTQESHPYDLTVAGDRLFFGAYDGRLAGNELWSSDGTPAGTIRMRDVPDGSQGSSPRELVSLGSKLLYAAYDVAAGDELWSSDGTVAGTGLLKDINTNTRDAVIGEPIVAGGRLYFRADQHAQDVFRAQELWSTDGTAAGTTLAFDGTRPYALTPFDGRLFFSADHRDSYGNWYDGLWSTDGTTDGTRLVKDLGGHAPLQMTTLIGSLYFLTLYNGTDHTELWKSDGTADGTTLVAQIPGGYETWVGTGLTAHDGSLYFFTYEDADGVPGTTHSKLFRSDGTAGGTVLLGDFGRDMSDATLTPLGDRMFFAADAARDPDDPGSDTGRELWVTDGTPAGTHLVKDINPGPDSANPRDLTAWRGRMWFTAFQGDGAGGGSTGLFSTDGTAHGTVRVDDPARGINPANLFLYHDALYFAGTSRDDGNTVQLWRTDGTDAGTHAVTTAGPGGASLDPADFADINHMLVFTGSAGDRRKLFVSNGTADGTSPVTGGYSARGGIPFVIGGRVLFRAFADAVGEEWFRTTIPDTSLPAVTGRWVFYNHSAFDGNDAAANDADDAAIARDKTPLLPGAAAGFANVSSFTRGINGVMVDVNGLPAGAAEFSAADFEFKTGSPAAGWSDAPPPTSVTVRRGAGPGGSDRVTLVWPDGAIRNTWLRVTVPAGARTGLAFPDVFYVGSLAGDADGDLRVNALDLATPRRALNTPATIESHADVNRDGRINSLDLAAVRANLSRSVEAISLPPPAGAAARPDHEGATAILSSGDA